MAEYIRPAELLPDQEVVERLEGLLSAAREGRLRAISYVGLCTESDFCYGMYGADARVSKLKIESLMRWWAGKVLGMWESGCGEASRSV